MEGDQLPRSGRAISQPEVHDHLSTDVEQSAGEDF
jgi:hypothetical protein